MALYKTSDGVEFPALHYAENHCISEGLKLSDIVIVDGVQEVEKVDNKKVKLKINKGRKK